jgi:hypothetical protein
MTIVDSPEGSQGAEMGSLKNLEGMPRGSQRLGKAPSVNSLTHSEPLSTLRENQSRKLLPQAAGKRFDTPTGYQGP